MISAASDHAIIDHSASGICGAINLGPLWPHPHVFELLFRAPLISVSTFSRILVPLLLDHLDRQARSETMASSGSLQTPARGSNSTGRTPVVNKTPSSALCPTPAAPSQENKRQRRGNSHDEGQRRRAGQTSCNTNKGKGRTSPVSS